MEVNRIFIMSRILLVEPISLTQYIPLMQVDSIEQGEQVMQLIKENIEETIGESPNFSLVLGGDIPEDIAHARDYIWSEPLVD